MAIVKSQKSYIIRAFDIRNGACLVLGLTLGLFLASISRNDASLSATLPASSHISRMVNHCGKHNYVYGRSHQTRVTDLNVTYASWTYKQEMNKSTYYAQIHATVENALHFPEAIDLLDVGANFGKAIFPLLALGRGDRVMAVEPVKRNIEVLCKTALLNDWLRNDKLILVHGAFSDQLGQQNIFIPGERTDNAALTSQAAVTHVKGSIEEETITLMDGDTLLHETGFRPRVIKIDTQGHELFVMKGLRQYLKRAGKGQLLIIAEFDRRLMQNQGVNPDDVLKYMIMDLGYNAFCRGEFRVVSDKLVAVSGNRLSMANFESRAKFYPGCSDLFYIRE